MKTPQASFASLFLLLTLTLVSCGDSGPSGSEIVVRELPKAHREFNLVDTSRERFRYQARETTSSERPNAAPQLVWDVPEGWTEKPAAMMRDINLKFGENGEGECYVARLPGAGGGLAANVNRWRKQMGAAELSQEEVEALPKRPLFGQPATLVSVSGDFSPGMGSQEVKKDYRLLGLILASDAGAVFVKMTGPRKLVDANAEKFEQFTSSIDVSMN